MSTDFEIEDKESNDYRGFMAESFFSNRLKEYLYGFFGHLFKEKYSHKTKIRTQVFYEILINFIIVLQLSPLAWYPKMEAKGWNSYVWFWQDISYISYDEICAYYSVMNFCFYGTVTLISTCFGSFIIFWLYIYFGKRIPKFISVLPKKIAMLFTSICIIPSTMILILVIKYSIINRSTIEEYSDSLSSDTYKFGIYGVIFGIICLAALIFVNIFCEAFSSDMKHSNSKINIKARTCADFDLQRRWFYVISCILNVFLGTDSVILFQCISFIYSFYLYLRSILDFQYFNPIENAIQASKMGSISALYFTFLFGQLLDDALLIIIFTLFLQPMVLFITIWIIYRGYKNLGKSIHNPKDQFEFEQKFRHLLTNEDIQDKAEVINVFKKYWKQGLFHKDKLFVIWEFNFCFFIMKDERLARIKISKIANAKSTFEGDAQEWRVFDWLIRKQHSTFPDTSYLEFLKEFNIVKSHDEELCFILTELHAEFASRTPRIEKLVNLVNRSANHISFVDAGYKNLIEKYKHVEALEMYAGYLENIINNHDEANMALKKKNGINYYSQRTTNASLENYGKELATILVSCADESFGTIVYLNEKASQILKAPIGAIHGSSIMNYIPQPYDALHESLIRNFIFECNSTEIIPHRQLFFQNHAGFLVETHFLIKLTAFHNCAYFLISFQPRVLFREIAILSEEGIIIGHTEAFPYYLGIQEKIVKNKKLSELIPILNIAHMKELEPWLLPFNNEELMIVLLKKNIKSKTIRILAVIHDDEGIANWKEGKSHDQIDFLSSLNLIEHDDDQVTESPATPKTIFNVKFQQINYSIASKTLDVLENETSTQFENLGDKNKVDQERNSDNNSWVSSTKNLNLSMQIYSKKLLMQSKRKIRVLQVILCIIVSSVIITVAAILGYMISDVAFTSRLKALSRFDQVIYDFIAFADIARSLSLDILNNSSSTTIDEDVSELQDMIENITDVQNMYFSDFEKWKHYPSSAESNNPIIPLWYFDKEEPELELKNLYNLISDFILNGQKILNALNEGQDFSVYSKFLYINGLGNAFVCGTKSLNGLIDNEIERVKKTGSTINVLLIFGFCTLGILVLVIIGYIILVSKKHDEFWNYILNNAQWSMLKLKCLAIERLATVHGIDNTSDSNAENQRLANTTRKVKMSIHLQYIWRLMLFFLIAASYYLLIYCYLYPICEASMKHRPTLLNNFISRRLLIARLSVISKETYYNFNYQQIPEVYPFQNQEATIDTMISLLRFKNKEIRQEKYLKLMSSELERRLYGTIDSKENSLKLGSEASSLDLVDDIETMIYWIFNSTADIKEFNNQIYILKSEIREEFELADRDSIDVINRELDAIVNVTIIYSVALCVLYFLYYLPYLNYQIKQLKRFSVLPSILPVDLDNRGF